MTPEVPARLQVGEMLSHYRVTDTLGAGGMGVVYYLAMNPAVLSDALWTRA